MILVDDDGQAYTIDPKRKRLPNPGDLRDLVRSGRARRISASGRPSDRPLRGVRAPMPATDVPLTMERPDDGGRPTSVVDPLRSADDALTFSAFVHVSDTSTDALDGYDIYLRAMDPLRARHRDLGLAVATPTSFRRRVDEVRSALAMTAGPDGPAAPTIH